MSGQNQTNTPYSKRVDADWLQMLDRAREVIRREAKALEAVAARLDEQICNVAEHILSTSGLVVVSGVGKSGLVGEKISATLASTGTRSISLDPLDALHGSLGRIRAGDVFLALSNSGETEELRQVVSALKAQPVFIALITGRANSSLAQEAHSVLGIGPVQEVCTLGLTPTTSTTAMMALGDALALIIQERRGFTERDFARFHPGGSLGRKLARVSDLMWPLETIPVLRLGAQLAEVLVTICGAGRGAEVAVVLGGDEKIVGVINPRTIAGDLMRAQHLELEASVDAYIQRPPDAIRDNASLSDAIQVFLRDGGDVLIVQDTAGRFIGLLSRRDVETNSGLRCGSRVVDV
ncbi:SIS domain-containing protein [Mesorhizobium sp.]|uniref:KpsF/GutQ family sugar-phosphate isomerase n=1 Tax=Mesorhizobium sp. TaxID=1871066 RepID=UPI0025F5FE51|nr:KpsF/GutQ family sugar-phosphate isomerase [Mesorhizobium sp.]